MSRAAIFFLLFVASSLSLILALLGLETLGTNLLGWLLLVVGIGYAAGVIILYGFLRKHFWEADREAVQQEHGDRSFWAIMPGMLVSFFASPLEYLYLAWFPPAMSIQVFGLVLVCLGMLLQVWARTSIKGMYSGHLQVTSGQALVTSGPYRFVRHPSYASLVLLASGIAIGFGSVIGLAAVPLLLLPGLAYRISVEEELLRDGFGDEFNSYARRVKKLIPGVW
jgi:protein-S-isoprenylcysteine O-methyltransferase Ste14